MKKNLLTIILLVAFVGILFMLDLPTYNSFTFLKQELKAYDSTLQEQQALVDKVNQLKAIYDSRKDELNKISFLLPSGQDIPGIIVQLETLSSENGLIMENLAFSEPEKSKAAATAEGLSAQQSSYKTLSATLSLSGNYQSLKSFLEALELNIRMMDIKSIGFSLEKEDSSIFTFDIKLDVYYQ